MYLFAIREETGPRVNMRHSHRPHPTKFRIHNQTLILFMHRETTLSNLPTVDVDPTFHVYLCSGTDSTPDLAFDDQNWSLFFVNVTTLLQDEQGCSSPNLSANPTPFQE